MPLKQQQQAPLYRGIVIEFDEASDFEFSEAIRKALLLLVGVGKAGLILSQEEVSVSLPEPKTQKKQ